MVSLSSNVIWAVIVLCIIIALYMFREQIHSIEKTLGTKFNTFIQPFRVSRASVFKNYLILLLLYILQIALNQEIPLVDVPNGVFLVLILITWVFWFVLSY